MERSFDFHLVDAKSRSWWTAAFRRSGSIKTFYLMIRELVVFAVMLVKGIGRSYLWFQLWKEKEYSTAMLHTAAA
jgi:hypothetical protein